MSCLRQRVRPMLPGDPPRFEPWQTGLSSPALFAAPMGATKR
jgi:hypothetical protein